ncbi:MAG: hypothetical protein JOY61_17840 [Chloroflexi bacterium]|nr:hypothetical protein [Chloroflexota bacterium]
MQPSSDLGNWVAVWLVAAGIIVLSRYRRGAIGAGLVTAFVISSCMAYFFGAAIYLLPWEPTSDPEVVATGFHQSTYALIAFGVGVLCTSALVSVRARRRVTSSVLATRIPEAYIVVGLACFLLLAPVLGRIPTAGAVLSQGWDLLVVGLGLACWRAWQGHRSVEFGRWLAATVFLPLLTVLTQGFLGYGAGAATAVLAFIGSFYRPRWRVFFAGLVLMYAALSLYVTYMRDRQDIRDAVWGGEPMGVRIQVLQHTLSSIERFDPSNQAHLERIDIRLNDNYLLGASVDYIQAGLAPFSYGQNLWDGVLNLVPRALWPTKPFVAGSGDIVSRYTGIHFAEGTSIGVGYVMEAYISFGTPGVIGLFLIFGIALTLVDMQAGRCLLEGDWFAFACWFLPALSLMPTESSFGELLAGAGSAFLVAYLANRLVKRYVFRSPRRRPLHVSARA